MTTEQEALRLADALLEYGRVLGPRQTGIHGASAAMLRKLVAEREADRAAMRLALEALSEARFVLDVATSFIPVPADADGPVVQIPAAITDLRQRLEGKT